MPMESITRILLIEDDQIDRLACRRALSRQSAAFEFFEADNGCDGVRLAHDVRPGCILLDYRLPDMTGLEVLAALSEADRTPPPVVMLTGANDVATAVEAMRAGARHYVLKDMERRYLELLPPILERVLREQYLTEEKRRAEAALAHAHRVMTAGELTATLAHELNQPLAAIATFSEACLQQLHRGTIEPEKLQRNIERIALQAQRAGQTISELRAFLTKGGATKDVLDLNQLIHATYDLLAADARARGIAIVLDLEEPLVPVIAARVHIEHVLMNLIQNAIDAMRSAGMPAGSITLSSRAGADNAVQVSVRDTGPGLDTDTANRIFEPFYTTKADGLGMGLVIARSILEAHEGRLWVESESGTGAAFHFTLPAAA